ncbi:unnamed protein product, partial [Mesorhabditis belari]|uniref:PPM-type phosphatase domain-containing protein n=1 Tax=Mesorhabditis belari TaxID=2138241 RepID=A0AAF3E941_9BILA
MLLKINQFYLIRRGSTLCTKLKEASGEATTSKEKEKYVAGSEIERDANGEAFREMFVMPNRKLRAQIQLEQLTGRGQVQKLSRFDIQDRLAVRTSRSKEMSPEQDWTNVWPAPRSFNASVVPLPVRMGSRPHPERRAPFKKFGNLELVKIPNFLHLTPAAIEKQCLAIKQFCTEYPPELKGNKELQKVVPLKVYYNDYVHQGSSLRDIRSRVTTTTLNVAALNLSSFARDKLQRLAGSRFDSSNGMLTILTDRCHTRQQNDQYAAYLLTVLYHEANKVEKWEEIRQREDELRIEYDGSTTQQKILSLLGKPAADEIGSQATLAETKEIRKGRLFSKWDSKKCILCNGTLRIERHMEEDEMLLVANYNVEITVTRRGKGLHLSNPTNDFLFIFDQIETLHLWVSRCLQFKVTSTCDLSDQRLVLLPDSTFLAPNLQKIYHLNLKRNSLQFKTCHQDELGLDGTWSAPQLGWIEDLYRFSALNHLDLSSNRLSMFPLAVLQLKLLTRLFLSDNQIDRIPGEIRLLNLLIEFDLANNWLSELPDQLGDCTELAVLNLTLNRFKKIPSILSTNPKVTHWQLAGNFLDHLIGVELKQCIKLDLRRNAFHGKLIIPSSGETLRWLDLRDNQLKSLSTTNCLNLRTLHCERNLLKELSVNGQNISYLNASFNALSSLIVLPMPMNLVFFSVASNQFSHLPNWITDLQKINHIDAHKNQLKTLPERIFRVPSLSTLNLHSNRLTKLPEQVENCQIEILNLHHNALENLPSLLFRSSHRLREVNVSANVLTEIPSPNPVPDLNRVQILHAAMNELDDRVVHTIIAMRRLRILNLSNNKIKFFNDSNLCSLTSLEELNLSSNRLSSISSLILALPSLQILRIHSNQINILPDLSQSKTLKIFDACSNRVSQMQSTNCLAENLRQVDLSCNPELPVHFSQRSSRIYSFVNIAEAGGHNVHVGFSECTGQRNRLSVRQILPNTRHVSPILAIIDTSGNASLAAELSERLFRMAETEEIVDENTLRNWILNAHEWMGESILLASICDNQVLCASVGGNRAWIVADGKIHPLIAPIQIDSKTYEQLRMANAIVDEENLIFGVCPYVRQIGFSAFFPAILPRATVRTAKLNSREDFLILGSRAVGGCLSEPLLQYIVASTSNPQVAAKRIQDVVQSFNWTDNVSVIVAQTGNLLNRKTKKSVNPYSISEREEISELTLQKIEERIEQISRVRK